MDDVNGKCCAFKQVQYFKSLDIFILHKEETFFIFLLPVFWYVYENPRLLKGSFKWVYADFVKLKCTHFFFRKKGCNPFSSLFRWIQVQRFQTTPKLIHNSISQWLDIKIFTLYKTIAIFLRRKWWIFLFYFHLEIVFFGFFSVEEFDNLKSLQ